MQVKMETAVSDGRSIFTCISVKPPLGVRLKVVASLASPKADTGPVYGCPEKFRESLSSPTVTFPKIFNGLLF